MPKIISFGWTWPAVVARRKTATRRDWDLEYAYRFRQGDVVLAYDRSPLFGGRPIAKIRLTQKPRYEPDAAMTDADYEAEGFAYLAEHPELLPQSARKQARVTLSREAFDGWRRAGGCSWVIRFEVLEVLV